MHKNSAMQSMKWTQVKAVQTEGSMLMCNNNTMHTMEMNQLMILIQQSLYHQQ